MENVSFQDPFSLFPVAVGFLSNPSVPLIGEEDAISFASAIDEEKAKTFF